jgi:hypothetical protein
MELHVLADRVRGEFAEMPGLCLTPAQASRLLGIEFAECQRVLDSLVNAAVLRRISGGSVVLADGAGSSRFDPRLSYK